MKAKTPQDLAVEVLRDVHEIQSYVERATAQTRWHDLEALLRLTAMEAARVLQKEHDAARFPAIPDPPTETTTSDRRAG